MNETAQPEDKGFGLGGKLGVLVALAPLVLISIPTVVLLAVAMLPTGVAWIVDRSIARLSWLAVGGVNLAGTVPFIAELWTTGHTIPRALEIITDVFAIMVIYGAAGIGWLLYSSIPQLLGTFMALTANRRIEALKAQQVKLIEDWGPEVKEGADHAVAEFMRRGRVSDFGPPGEGETSGAVKPPSPKK
ncbi:hypothetical protein [Pararhodospirillum photometricum]|uniref:Uncharacterized protein n=1 Tax=Pararhodospirillum photometricum DSM 122 TaxID=1150469 RepID=H6SKI5_PARPM|nr:hypothetical protein [Pararhodospirillum photometricum]CCG08500.1 Putative uncharacterized protein [Pararhodospirillum photometricum DSM 122]